MSENTINQNAAAALVRVANIQDIARFLASDLLLCFGDVARPRCSVSFEIGDGVQCLEDIRDLAAAAIEDLKALASDNGAGVPYNPDDYPPDPPENIAAEYGPNSPPW